MRTALIAWDYPPALSGLSTAAREIAESLVQTGADATVFTLDRGGTSVVGGVRIVGCAVAEASALGRLRLWGGAGHLAAPLAFRCAVLAEHGRAPFDVVEATNWYAPASLLTGERFALVTRHSTPAAFSRDPARSVRDRIDAFAADRLERRQARGSDAAIYNRIDHGRRMDALYGLEGRPHAVMGLSLAPDFTRRSACAPYPGEGPVRLLFVGRAEHRKGFDALLDAVGILAEEAAGGRLPAFELRLLGVPAEDLPAPLPDRTRACLTALGRRPGEALHDEYAHAHIVVAPSRYESFGLVYEEAVAYGRAVVASAEDASAREAIGGIGALATETSGPALAEALRPLIASTDRRLELRDRALKAAGRSSRATLGERTLDLYERAIAARQSR